MCVCFRRCLHLGDFDAGREAVPGGEEQRRYWENRKRRAVAASAQLPAPIVLANVFVLELRTQQTAEFQRN